MQRKEIEKVYIKKINELKKHDEAYFEQDSPIIPDKDYDIIKQEILNLEKKYNYLKNKNSPSKKVGYEPSGKFKKIEHDIPMLSLANAFSKENIKDFLKKIKNFGISRIIYTDIYKDGTKQGPNIKGAIELSSKVKIPLVISGGVSSIEDIERIKSLNNQNIEGVIIGKAIYDGDIQISDLAKLI